MPQAVEGATNTVVGLATVILEETHPSACSTDPLTGLVRHVSSEHAHQVYPRYMDIAATFNFTKCR